MHTQLLEYFQAGNLLTESQSGFRPNHSTSKALKKVINLWVLWRTNIDAGKLSDSEFIDLKKAFDIVDHNILLRKLCCYGVNGNAFQLFKSYLTDRTQRCYVNGILSTEQYVSWGIPRQNLAKAKFMNLKMDDRPIEYKPSTKLLGVHIDDTLTWDNQIKHISSKVSNGVRCISLENWPTIKRLWKLFSIHLECTSLLWLLWCYMGWLLQNTCWQTAKVAK